MTKTKGTRRAEDRRSARKRIKVGEDPNPQVRKAYGGGFSVSRAEETQLTPEDDDAGCVR
jgi:hypothetical protein